MMKVLVQYDASGNEAQGLWWVDPISFKPQSLYKAPESAQAARGRMIVFGKTNDRVSWTDWFDQLTQRQPYSEDWAVYDSMDMTPEQLLAALQPSTATAV